MNKNQQKALWIVAALVVVVAVAGAWYWHYEGEPYEMEGGTAIPTDNSSSTAGGTQSHGLVSDVTAASLSYGQAIAIFANTRIQFDATCTMTPTNFSVKNGSTLMFDNRSKSAMTFKLDGVRYSLPGYGFRLFALTAAHLPHIVDVDCGGHQNSGTIDLQ